MATLVVFDSEGTGDGGTEETCYEEWKGEGGEGVTSWVSSA